MAIGLWREKDGWANEHSVRVRYDDDCELDMPESKYRAEGHKPEFESLRWKEAKNAPRP